jgi:excinuclease ABC subunit A
MATDDTDRTLHDRPRRTIEMRGVRVHNLKGVDLDLPHGRLAVFTGVSGSGKSSLAFDTLFAEGQRRYIETFSPYVRQFLSTLDRPDADRLTGLPPAVAISQKMSRRSARSTVGTVTETHEHLALLFARVGRVICPDCRVEVRPADLPAVVAAIEALEPGTRYQIAFPVPGRTAEERTAGLSALQVEGFIRARIDGRPIVLDQPGWIVPEGDAPVEVVVDRLVRGSDDRGRRTDSIETALRLGQGECRLIVSESDGGESVRSFHRGWRCGSCGRGFVEPTPALFRYGSALGACPACEGFGRAIDLSLARIVPDPSRTIAGGAITPWTTPAYREWQSDLIAAAPRLGLPTDRPFKLLDPDHVRMIVEGFEGFAGLRGFFQGLERKAYKMHVRVFLSRWRDYTPCPVCHGARLRPEALAVEVAGRSIAALSALPVAEALAILENDPSLTTDVLGRRLVQPICLRLGALDRIGLGYLTLDRLARTLSGGESRRVALTSALGSGLVNTLYVLDEPSIGLHPRDVERLTGELQSLRDSGNTVVVVEHETSIMRAADLLVDIGPGAGEGGGQLLYAGPPDGIADCPGSVTGDFLADRRRVSVPRSRRAPRGAPIELRGASGNNLKGIDVAFPLGVLCVVTGVSGSGKSTLVEETLYPAVQRRLKGEAPPSLPFRSLAGASSLGDVVLVDQSPIGRTPRSNPATYLRAFDEIRKTFASTHEAKLRNFTASKFSFNVEGGRCSTCEGNGYQVIDMQFLPDVLVKCPECRGTRYRPEVLQATYRGKSIAEVLDLTARSAFAHFRHRPSVQGRLRPLLEVGLDYLRLGQPATTLSGGEAQRLKLAAHLAGDTVAAEPGQATLFLLDEPTTGLHPADIQTLLQALERLVDLGHSLIVVEHHLDVMAAADWIIDLGPEAGDTGGQVVAQGTPEQVAQTDTATGRALRDRLGPPP